MQSTYLLHYYFAVQEWNLVGHLNTAHQVPVLAELVGHQIWSNGTVTALHHFYDFVDFNTAVSDDYFKVWKKIPLVD